MNHNPPTFTPHVLVTSSGSNHGSYWPIVKFEQVGGPLDGDWYSIELGAYPEDAHLLRIAAPYVAKNMPGLSLESIRCALLEARLQGRNFRERRYIV